jgi:DNA-binding transcriptional regulator YiaG
VKDPIDIEEIRHWMRMTHQDFAKAIRVSVPTLWRWRKKGVPEGPARKLFERLQQEMLAERSAPPSDPWSAL